MELGWPKISGENIVSLVLSTLSKVKVAKENSTNSEVKCCRPYESQRFQPTKTTTGQKPKDFYDLFLTQKGSK